MTGYSYSRLNDEGVGDAVAVSLHGEHVGRVGLGSFSFDTPLRDHCLAQHDRCDELWKAIESAVRPMRSDPRIIGPDHRLARWAA